MLASTSLCWQAQSSNSPANAGFAAVLVHFASPRKERKDFHHWDQICTEINLQTPLTSFIEESIVIFIPGCSKDLKHHHSWRLS
jgi:hypothetical protein